MRFTTVSKTLAMMIASVALLSACSTPIKEEPKPVPVVEQPMVKEEPKPEVKTVKAEVIDTTNGPQGVKTEVFFDYDKYDIKDEYKPVIEGHAKFLVANPNRSILVQGNTDERGGREYNIALGQKRAEAVRKALALLGVKEAQVEAVSLGKDKPRATGSDEASWAQNRRSDIIYKK